MFFICLNYNVSHRASQEITKNNVYIFIYNKIGKYVVDDWIRHYYVYMYICIYNEIYYETYSYL